MSLFNLLQYTEKHCDWCPGPHHSVHAKQHTACAVYSTYANRWRTLRRYAGFTQRTVPWSHYCHS